ncbi:MAG: Rieske 2Fe-2S domain-containing protein [Methylobacterium sp.]|uniref:Rieske (2Fe-2S) protein n=1 Tax=Methylobacterium sp. TaxID=409 RepID=UPI0025ED6B8F|nr:Rieske 2Fe-2S domain-containing protein [Methylobacterium sp.]MBX9932366.1 Rieske 2Fe-2S domain-containing protein [Methylobacterium sp.]
MCGKPISVAEAERAGWIHLGPTNLLGDRDLMPIVVGRKPLILLRDGDRILAVERACPHEGADLTLGRCTDGRLFCPRHLASFDLRDGSVSAGWSFRALRLFSVRATPDGLWLSMDDGPPSPKPTEACSAADSAQDRANGHV